MGSWRKLPSDDLGRELLRNRLRQRFDVFHAGFCVQYLPLAYTRAVRMDDSCIENANRRLLALLSAARPMLVDVRQARDVIPGLGAYDLLHAGPPLVQDDAVCGALDGAIRGTLILDGAPSMPSVGS